MKLQTLLLLLALMVSCGDGGDPPPDEPKLTAPTSLDVRDISNLGNGSDLELSFIKPADLDLVEEFRVFVVKSDQTGSFDSLTALSNTSHVKIGPTSSENQLTFNANLSDSQGDLVIEGVDYNVFVLAFGIDDLGGALSAASNTIRLEQKSAVRTLTAPFDAGTGGMDVDSEGNIYMGDFGATLGSAPGTRVHKITPDGQVSVFASGLVGASGNDFDNDGNLYQSNIQGGTVSKITPEGAVSTFASGFRGPVGIVFDGEANFYVCNCTSNTISKVDLDGNVSLFSSSGLLVCPNGIDIDDEGNLYIANFNSETIVKITPEGAASSFAVMPGNNMGHLLIGGEFIYVVGRGNNAIYRVNFQGQVSLFAGTGIRGLANGSLDQASFSLPNDMAFSPDGTKIYINDVASEELASTGIISPVVIREIDIK